MTDLNGKRFQLTFLRPSTMLQFADVLCDPPLGQSTVIARSQSEVSFVVVIESSISFSDQPWHAIIWHNGHDSQEWGALELHEVRLGDEPLAVAPTGRPNVYRHYFRGTIPCPNKRPSTINFTLKYRTTKSAWKWVNEDSNLTDGELLFQTDNLPQQLKDCLDGLPPDIRVSNPSSDVPDTNIWQLSLDISAATTESSFSNQLLGIPKDIARWFALVRIWTPWLCPRHGKHSLRLSEDGVVLSFLRNDGLHFVLVAVSGLGNTYSIFKDNGEGGIVLNSRNDGADPETSQVIVAIGYEQGPAFAACLYHARKLVTTQTHSLQSQQQQQQRRESEIDASWMSEWYDGLTYCTWNGLGQGLTEEKIFHALRELDRNNIKITNLIIDDNWQSLDNPGMYQDARGWTDFEANEQGFSRGLGQTVADIRRIHPNIEHVAVWHAILGYWGGISATGNIAKTYKTTEIRKASLGRVQAGLMTVVAAEDVERLYDDFYSFLSKAGIDSVKTDAQFFLDLIHDPKDRRELFKTYQDVWTVASLKHFGTKAISCMSLVPGIIFHSQLPANKPRIMVRNSDDFFPEIPSSHAWHIFTNAFTSVLTQHLNVLPDWDMFQTAHDYSKMHGAARCVSGGPIYITDEPGKHSIDLINQMTALSVHDGRRIILRPSTIGKTIPSSLYTAYEEERLLKVGTYHGHSETGYGILGVFNVSKKAMSDVIFLRDFPGVIDDQEYVIRAHSGGISPRMRKTDPVSLVSLHLDVKGCEILTAHPVKITNNVAITPLGLLGKMTGAASIVEAPSMKEENGKIRVSIKLKALGVLGCLLSVVSPRKKPLSLDHDLMATISKMAIPKHTVSYENSVLKLNIEEAVNEMDIPKTWSNEMLVEIFVF